ncbi:MAG: hypothetical protein K1X51_12145 [Rhodospirillaceae bacterium]|nr:hypothetical protein [Rhodospirillaceae bacterium]
MDESHDFPRAHVAPLALVALFITLLRALYFNNPAVNIDEQFYLMAADRWLNHGQLPFVDIWDRKPIGIFLIYAPAVLWFKNGVLGYQLLGLAATLATAAVVYRMGLWFGGRFVALAGAVFYGAILMLWSGAGGQTPVFYNLPMALGAYLILKVLHAPSLRGRAIAASFLGAAFLFGLALQIKYICVFEICALSLLGLGALLADKRLTPAHAAALAFGMVILGLAPTAAAGAVYTAIGHWDEFWFSNFVSIFGKKSWRFTLGMYLLTVASALIYCVIFWIFTGIALARGLNDRPAVAGYKWLVLGLALWLAAAVFGALMLGNPILHYFLPTAVPLALLSALGVERLAERRATEAKPFGAQIKFWFGGSVALCCIAALVINIQSSARRGAAQVYPAAAFLKEHLDRGCPYVFNDFPVLYYLTQCAAPSVYAFPNHLTETAELHALAVDTETELRRVLGNHPGMIFVRRPFPPELDAGQIAILEDVLKADYEPAKQFPAFHQEFTVYFLKGKS